MVKKAPVSARALTQRINRALAQKHGKIGSPPFPAVQLKKTRGGRAVQDLGEFYIVNVYRNAIIETNVDLDEKARELKVLADWEELSEQEVD